MTRLWQIIVAVSLLVIASGQGPSSKSLTPTQIPPAPTIRDVQPPLVVYDADGTVWTLTSYVKVQVGGVYSATNPTPGPGPTPPPPPTPDPTARGKEIRDAILKITTDPNRSSTAKQIASFYRNVAAVVGTQINDVTSLADKLRIGTDEILKGNPAASSTDPSVRTWADVRGVLSGQWAIALLPPKNGTIADLAVLLNEAAGGLDASAQSTTRDLSYENQMAWWVQQILARQK